MTFRLLILILGTVYLTSCLYSKIPNQKKVRNTADLKTEKGREDCILTDHEEFFGKMINQRLSKIQGNNWDILFKDTSYIYYGYTLLTKEGLYADSIFKVKRTSIEDFPKFEELEFHQIRSTILGYAYKDYSFGDNYTVQAADDSFRLRQNIIFVDTKRKFKTWKSGELKKRTEEIHIKLAVDAKTLELLSKAEIGVE
jgi:hypothetical protein